MRISMIGIDHSRASVDIRAVFSFTKKRASEFMARLKEDEGIAGCVLLSTCNRTELYASVRDGYSVCLFDLLCEEKGVDGKQWKQYFVNREKEEAVEHLFFLTAGLKSQILAEDQIITQVKDALAQAREAYCTDGTLEVLFRMAVTAAKKVKSQVVFSKGDSSVIDYAIRFLEGQGFSLEGKTGMVIGNGEMGRSAALALAEKNVDVTVTVRQYRSGEVKIPEGCKRINYEERKVFLKRCDLVVSATSSPNYTVTRQVVEQAGLEGSVIMIDLAVPRDIEPEIRELKNVTLYDMDDFKTAAGSHGEESFLKAEAILREQMEEFSGWLSGRDFIPRIQNIRRQMVEDLILRIEKTYKRAAIEDAERTLLLETVDRAAGKAADKMIFGMKDALSREAFSEYLEAMENMYDGKEKTEFS